MKNVVYEALQAMRPPFAAYEMDIHAMVGERLTEAGLAYLHEAMIGKGCRIDYLVGDVGIEIKKGKPALATLMRQLARYAASESVVALIVVSQWSVRLPHTIGGKPLSVLVLNQLWGVALP